MISLLELSIVIVLNINKRANLPPSPHQLNLLLLSIIFNSIEQREQEVCVGRGCAPLLQHLRGSLARHVCQWWDVVHQIVLLAGQRR